MRDIKRRMEYYPSYDRSGIAAHLEAMAAQGWLLERITSSFWYYRRSEPQELHYAVTYDAGGSAFDPVPDEAKSEFYELCAHEGWEFVTAFAEMQIFANRRKHPTPLETDPVVELEAIERSAGRRLTRPYWAILAFSIVVAFLGLGGLISDPLYALTGLWGVPVGLMFLLLGSAAAAELISYYRWRKQAREAAARGESVETKGPVKLTRALILASYVPLTLALINILIAGDNLCRLIFAVLLAAILISTVAARASVDRLRRSGSSRAKSRSASFIIPFAVTLALCGALIGFSGSFTGLAEESYNGDPRYVNYSLSLSDLTDADLSGYIRAQNHRASVILEQSGIDESYHENYRGGPGEDLGALEYRTTIPKFAALYGFCENIASRGGEPVDAAPWGAKRAYHMGGNDYTLCYDGRIVEISLPFSPTPQQQRTVGEKLGA